MNKPNFTATISITTNLAQIVLSVFLHEKSDIFKYNELCERKLCMYKHDTAVDWEETGDVNEEPDQENDDVIEEPDEETQNDN